MRNQLYSITQRLRSIIDLFYPPFKTYVDRQTFRYAASGGSNTFFDIFLYYIIYHYVLNEKIFYAGGIAISPHIAAFLLSFPISFVTGFLLMRYVVFPESTGTRKRVQMPRYLLVVFICILLNYGFLKLFVEVFGWWPLPSKIVTTVFVVMFSYYSQKKFTFRN